MADETYGRMQADLEWLEKSLDEIKTLIRDYQTGAEKKRAYCETRFAALELNSAVSRVKLTAIVGGTALLAGIAGNAVARMAGSLFAQ